LDSSFAHPLLTSSPGSNEITSGDSLTSSYSFDHSKYVSQSEKTDKIVGTIPIHQLHSQSHDEEPGHTFVDDRYPNRAQNDDDVEDIVGESLARNLTQIIVQVFHYGEWYGVGEIFTVLSNIPTAIPLIFPSIVPTKSTNLLLWAIECFAGITKQFSLLCLNFLILPSGNLQHFQDGHGQRR